MSRPLTPPIAPLSDGGLTGPATAASAPPWPTTVEELTEAERLALFAFRSWVQGQTGWSRAVDILGHRLDADPTPALRGLTRLIVSITAGARRKVRVHRPGCPCLGADEAWFLCLTAAAQARQPKLTAALIRWVVREDAAGDTLDAAQAFGTALQDLGVALRLRTDKGSRAARASGEIPALRTVH